MFEKPVASMMEAKSFAVMCNITHLRHLPVSLFVAPKTSVVPFIVAVGTDHWPVDPTTARIPFVMVG